MHVTHAYLYFLSLIAARTVVVALFIIGGFRLLGKRQIGQLNIYDLAMVMLVANSVQNGMTSGLGDLSMGMVCSGSLILLGWLFSRLFVKLPGLESRVVGTPTVLVQHGQILQDRMKKERITEETLKAAIRQHGIDNAAQVKLAVLEVDGTISIIPK